MFYHVSITCMPMFLADVNSFLENVWLLSWFTSVEKHTKKQSRGQNFYVKGSPTGSLSLTKSVTSSICLCPEGLWSPLTLSLNVRTLQFLSEYIGFHHPLGWYRFLSPFFHKYGKCLPALKFGTGTWNSKELKKKLCYLSFPLFPLSLCVFHDI